MIYITGDLHGDKQRLKDKQLRHLKKGDTLIVCGDFGFLWDGSKKESTYLKKMGKLKYNILFIEGTHDNLDLIGQYPLEDWNGGKVRRISGNLLKLERGSIYTIEGKSIFTFGGGESIDLDERLKDNMWWSQELPTEEELQLAKANLEAQENKVDYIITHECSSKVKSFIDMKSDHINMLTAFFDHIAEEVEFKGWYFGCYHMDKIIPPHYHAMFQHIKELQ